MAAPYKPKDVIAESPASPPPDPSAHMSQVVTRAPTDAEIAAYLQAKTQAMTGEEVDAANIAHQRRLVLQEMEARKAAKANLVPTPKDRLVVVRLTHDYWPSPQQVIDNPQVPGDLSVLPPPQEDRVGVEIQLEARYRAGAVVYLDMDTALKLLENQKAVRADPLTTVRGNA